MNWNNNTDPRLAKSLRSLLESLTDEQKEKAKQLKTMDELMKFLGREGVELPDEMLDTVSGGSGTVYADGTFDGWAAWDWSNPWGYGTPMSYYLAEEPQGHDYCVGQIAGALDAGDYESAKKLFSTYKCHYGFPIIINWLNMHCAQCGLPPLE